MTNIRFQLDSEESNLIHFDKKYLKLDINISQTAADSALQHLVIVIVCVAQGLLVALQSFLEDTQAQESVAHAKTYLTVELQAYSGTLHV